DIAVDDGGVVIDVPEAVPRIERAIAVRRQREAGDSSRVPGRRAATEYRTTAGRLDGQRIGVAVVVDDEAAAGLVGRLRDARGGVSGGGADQRDTAADLVRRDGRRSRRGYQDRAGQVAGRAEELAVIDHFPGDIRHGGEEYALARPDRHGAHRVGVIDPGIRKSLEIWAARGRQRQIVGRVVLHP